MLSWGKTWLSETLKSDGLQSWSTGELVQVWIESHPEAMNNGWWMRSCSFTDLITPSFPKDLWSVYSMSDMCEGRHWWIRCSPYPQVALCLVEEAKTEWERKKGWGRKAGNKEGKKKKEKRKKPNAVDSIKSAFLVCYNCVIKSDSPLAPVTGLIPFTCAGLKATGIPQAFFSLEIVSKMPKVFRIGEIFKRKEDGFHSYIWIWIYECNSTRFFLSWKSSWDF